MRILFTFMGGNGHFVPLISVAKAAEAGGHEVAFAGGPSMVETVAKTGFRVFGLGTAKPGAPERLPLRPLDAAREDAEFREYFARQGTHDRFPLTKILCEEWKPDVVVSDETDFGSMMAAEQLGLPHATVLVMAAGSFVRAEVTADVLNEIRSEFGLAPDNGLHMLYRHLALVPFPPSFRDPAVPLPPTAFSFRPAGRVTSPLPGWWPDVPECPVVYFTLGTVFNMESGDLFGRVLGGLRDLPVRVLVTVGRFIDPVEFGPQPAHIHIEQYVAQETVLPYCDMVISHGGSGSLSGALLYGLPSVLIPMGADQISNAARAVGLGLAVNLDPVALRPEDVKVAVMKVLEETSYREVAGRLADEFAGLPGPDEAVRRLEGLVGGEVMLREATGRAT